MEGAQTGRADRTTLVAFAALVLLVGSNVVAIRFSNRELAPMWGAGLRFALAALIFWVIALARRSPIPKGRALAGAALYGLYLTSQWQASTVSYQFVLTPFVGVALGALLLGETVTPFLVAGGALVLIGVYVGALANRTP